MHGMSEENVNSVCQALDAGKKRATIMDFYGVGTNTVADIDELRKAIIAKDHAIAARIIFGDNGKSHHLGGDTKKAVMRYYGYHVPEEYLPKLNKQSEVKTIQPAQNQMADYRPWFQALMTQMGQINATLTALLKSNNDTGMLLHTISERLDSFTPSVSRDMDLIKQSQEVMTENLNTIIQQIGSWNDRVKYIASQLKK